MSKSDIDVRIVMTRTMRGEDSIVQGTVHFVNGMEQLIGAPRVILLTEDNRLMFKPVDQKVPRSLALSGRRIQLAKDAENVLGRFEGAYSLRHDDATNFYYIDLADKKEDVFRCHHASAPHPTAPGHAYTPYVSESPDVAANIPVEDEQLCSPDPGYEPVEAGKIDCRLPKQYRREILMNLLLDFVEDGAIEPAQQVAKLIREL